MFSNPSKSSSLQISPLPLDCLISEVPGDHSLRGDDIGTRKKKMGCLKERERKSREDRERLQLQ